MNISENEFKKRLETAEKFVVVFSAVWCGPCRAFTPVFEKASEEAGIPLLKLDVDEYPKVTAAYGVNSVPTLIVFDKGAEVKRHSGTFATIKKVLEFISK
jgi:thioredoxin